MGYQSISGLVGQTPLLQLNNIKKAEGITAQLFAKLEYFNPAGSVKDRVAKALIEDAEQRGLLKPGGVIIEPTSGNTGIGLAAIGASKGYRVLLTMPDTMSVERQLLFKAYGAQMVLTEGAQGMQGAIDKATQLAMEIKGSYMPGQFSNKVCVKAHRETTGPEIWEQAEGKLDVFVAGVGTGGTITGAGGYLKQKNPELCIIAVEPETSPVLSGGQRGPHGIQGIGAGFVPDILDTSIYDEIIKVSDADAFHAGRLIARAEGLLCGVSSGAALHAALTVARRKDYASCRMVVLMPDTGEHYLSGPMFLES